MLKQILRDMHIDPEILAGLDDTQKQTLFCKMREEQIRRWRLWDEKHERLEAAVDAAAVPSQPTVQFRTGEDGEPWVWVMGEHHNDRSIDQILAEEAQLRARSMAEQQTKELRRSIVAEMVGGGGLLDDPKLAATESATAPTTPNTNHKLPADDVMAAIPEIVDDLEIYCTVDELRDRIAKSNNNHSHNSSPLSTAQRNTANKILTDAGQNPISSPRIPNFRTVQPAVHKADVLREITHSNRRPANQKVSSRIAMWETRVIGEKTNEILKLMKQKQQDAAAEAENAARKREQEWLEQETRAKEAEVQMRDIARKAREEHRKSITIAARPTSLSSASSLSTSSLESSTGGPAAGTTTTANATTTGTTTTGSSPSSLDSNISRPPNADAVYRWYREEEFQRDGGIDRLNNQPHRWFHGQLSRPDAEKLLDKEAAGTFLVRLSDKIWGYAISYRDEERCKHYLVDASSAGSYQFLGANQLSHDSLNELIRFHANVPITLAGQELLLLSCAPKESLSSLLDGLMD